MAGSDELGPLVKGGGNPVFNLDLLIYIDRESWCPCRVQTLHTR